MKFSIIAKNGFFSRDFHRGLTGLVTSCVGTAFCNMLLKERCNERLKGRKDGDENVSS